MATLYVIPETMATTGGGCEHLSPQELDWLTENGRYFTKEEEISAEEFALMSERMGEITRIVFIGCFFRSKLNLPGVTQGYYYYLVDWQVSPDYPSALRQ